MAENQNVTNLQKPGHFPGWNRVNAFYTDCGRALES